MKEELTLIYHVELGSIEGVHDEVNRELEVLVQLALGDDNTVVIKDGIGGKASEVNLKSIRDKNRVF